MGHKVPHLLDENFTPELYHWPLAYFLSLFSEHGGDGDRTLTHPQDLLGVCRVTCRGRTANLVPARALWIINQGLECDPNGCPRQMTNAGPWGLATLPPQHPLPQPPCA